MSILSIAISLTVLTAVLILVIVCTIEELRQDVFIPAIMFYMLAMLFLFLGY